MFSKYLRIIVEYLGTLSRIVYGILFMYLPTQDTQMFLVIKIMSSYLTFLCLKQNQSLYRV